MPVHGTGDSPSGEIPLKLINDMVKQGLSNNQIIQTLQRDGYSTTAIFDALNKFHIQPNANPFDNAGGGNNMINNINANNTNNAIPNQNTQNVQNGQNGQNGQNNLVVNNGVPSSNGNIPPAPRPSSGGASPQGYPNQNPYQAPPMNSMGMGGMSMDGDQVSTEELIEAIIDEKWNDIAQDIAKIIAWKDDVSARIERLEEGLNNLKEDFNKLHEGVLGKIGEYDNHIMQVGAEVKAMEKVFSKVLPAFTSNVAELSKISEDLKKVRKR